jgi:multiple sugar transport system substrate-binding protein
LAAGTGAPDVAMIEGGYMGKFKDGSGLENLYDAPYNAKGMKKDFVEMKWNLAISADDKRLSGIPWDIGPATYFYRKDVFKSVGLPSEPDAVYKLMSTYDGILKVAQKVYIKGKRWLLPNAAYLYTWNFMNRDFYNEKLELQLDRKGTMDGLNAAIKMRKNGWDAKVTDMWTNEANAGLANGSILSVVAGGWYGGFLKSWVSPKNAGKWGVTRLPAGMPDSNWGGSYLAIPSQSKNKEVAWEFIKYALVNANSQNTMFKKVDYFPAYKPAWNDKSIYDAKDPYFDGQKTKALWVDISKHIKPVFSTLMDSTTDSTIYSTVNTGLNENKTAAQIVEMIKKAVSDATAEDREKNIEILQDAGKWK